MRVTTSGRAVCERYQICIVRLERLVIVVLPFAIISMTSDIPWDTPEPELDEDCYLGMAYALSYHLDGDGFQPNGLRQPVECCAYPGTGKVN